MKTILPKSPHEPCFSLSKRYFNWKKKVQEDEQDDEEEDILTSSKHSASSYLSDSECHNKTRPDPDPKAKHTKLSKLKYVLSIFVRTPRSRLGTFVVGTLYGNRRGNVHFAVQDDTTLFPAVVIQLPSATSVLVREMASGLVRIALECEKKKSETEHSNKRKSHKKLLEESTWRAYCNGKKCGFAVRKECGPEERAVLRAVGPVTMGAGVIPAPAIGNGAVGSEIRDVMYMRARFERVVGSRDSEAYYMMNPDGSSGGPELSVYFLRV